MPLAADGSPQDMLSVVEVISEKAKKLGGPGAGKRAQGCRVKINGFMDTSDRAMPPYWTGGAPRCYLRL